MSRTEHPLVMIGSGPGIGTYVSSVFATRRYNKVALVARRQEQLDKDRRAVEAAAPDVTVRTYVADVSDTIVLESALRQIQSELGTPETVFFNAAQVHEDFPLEATEEDLEHNFKVGNLPSAS